MTAGGEIGDDRIAAGRHTVGDRVGRQSPFPPSPRQHHVAVRRRIAGGERDQAAPRGIFHVGPQPAHVMATARDDARRPRLERDFARHIDCFPTADSAKAVPAMPLTKKDPPLLR